MSHYGVQSAAGQLSNRLNGLRRSAFVAASSETVSQPDSAEDTEETDGSQLRAQLSPFSGDTETAKQTVDITVYVVTGWHGKLRVPESFCKECHMFTRRAQLASETVDIPVRISVRSWWTHFPWALRRGGYHPPVMIVGGKRLCQGHDVPTTEEVVGAIERAKERSR